MRFLQPHPPLVVQFDGHAAAAGRVLADPAEELLELPSQGGVLLAGLGIAGAALQPLIAGGGGGGRVAPVAPDAGLPGAVDAHRVAPHLDEIDGTGPEACEPT